jgi:hypothetical protein
MNALRVVVLVVFSLSVAVTVWSLFEANSHNMHGAGGDAGGDMANHGAYAGQAAYSHILHIVHVILIVLAFLLIALYLLKSAEIASLTMYRELKLRMTVDSSAGFIEYLPGGAPIFNACAGALAKKGIYVKSAGAMTTLAKLDAIHVPGGLTSRAGYAVTAATLADMGAKLTDDADSCPVKILLGPFDPETGPDNDFVLTNDKITHILAAVYISKVFIRFSRVSRIVLICALAVAAALLAFMQFTFAAAAIALWGASEVIIIHRIARRTAKLTFKSVSSL